MSTTTEPAADDDRQEPRVGLLNATRHTLGRLVRSLVFGLPRVETTYQAKSPFRGPAEADRRQHQADRVNGAPTPKSVFAAAESAGIELLATGDARLVRVRPNGRQVPPPDIESPMIVTRGVYEQIRQAIGSHRAERGGMLGGSRVTGVVDHFQMDHTARRTGVTYSPDVDVLNALLRDDWNPSGVNLLGFVHSHPGRNGVPSQGDLVYAERILKAIPEIDRLLLPIVQTEPDAGAFTLRSYCIVRATKGVELLEIPLNIVDEAPQIDVTEPTFERVAGAYDLERMASVRLVVVGVGGAAAFVEEMARCGVGEFVLIDPDVVDVPNLATQQVYRRDLGRPKVDAVADRVLDVSPWARVATLHGSLDDLSDAEVSELVRCSIRPADTTCPVTTVLCGFTDDFHAQARVNQLALRNGVPMLAAQVYQHGRGCEVSFHAPGITPACGRCVLGGRYRAFEEGYENTVGSGGTPLFATTRLNALKAEVALAIVHGWPHPTKSIAGQRWIDLLNRIANRNLIQVRLDPDIATTLGLQVFDSAFAACDERVVVDETVWLTQKPENEETGFPTCPHCGGTGNLWDAQDCVGPADTEWR